MATAELTFWVAIAVFSGLITAILGVSLLLKYTGIGEFISHVLSIIGTFFNSVFSLTQSLIHSAPSFFKMIFFILIFWSCGTLLYNNTIGLTYACGQVNNELYHGSFFAGMGYAFIPGTGEIYNGNFSRGRLDVQPSSLSVGLESNTNGTDTGLIVYDAWHTGNTDTPYFAVSNDYPYDRLSNFVQSYFGSVTNVVGQDNIIKYYICYDDITGSCTAKYSQLGCGEQRDDWLYSVRYTIYKPQVTTIDRFFNNNQNANKSVILNYDITRNDYTKEYKFLQWGPGTWGPGISKCTINSNLSDGVNINVEDQNGIVYGLKYLPIQVGTEQQGEEGSWRQGSDFEYMIPNSDTKEFKEIVQTGSSKQLFLDKYFDKQEKTSSMEIISVTCDGTKNGLYYNDEETVRLFAIPILEFKYIALICGTIALLGIINFFKHK